MLPVTHNQVNAVSCRRMNCAAGRWMTIARAIWLALLAVGIGSCAPSRQPPRVVPGGDAQPLLIEVTQDGRTRVVSVPLEGYVRGVVLAEGLVSEPDISVLERFLEIQTLLVRTYGMAHRGRHRAEGFDLCSTTHCQLYRPERVVSARMQQALTNAINRTAGLVIQYRGAPIDAVYHSHCGGHTSSAQAVWGGPAPPYLRGVPDTICLRDPKPWTYVINVNDMRAILNRHAKSRVGRRLDALSVIDAEPGGLAAHVKLDGELTPMLRGEELRALITAQRGADSIKSPKFQIARKDNTFVFTGRGSGHGAGLCQAGALARVRQGDSPLAVVNYYYPDTDVARLR